MAVPGKVNHRELATAGRAPPGRDLPGRRGAGDATTGGAAASTEIFAEDLHGESLPVCPHGFSRQAATIPDCSGWRGLCSGWRKGTMSPLWVQGSGTHVVRMVLIGKPCWAGGKNYRCVNRKLAPDSEHEFRHPVPGGLKGWMAAKRTDPLRPCARARRDLGLFHLR